MKAPALHSKEEWKACVTKDKWETATYFRRVHLMTISWWLKACAISLLLSHKPNSSVLMAEISTSLCRPIKRYMVQSLNVYRIVLVASNHSTDYQWEEMRFKVLGMKWFSSLKEKGDCKYNNTDVKNKLQWKITLWNYYLFPTKYSPREDTKNTSKDTKHTLWQY